MEISNGMDGMSVHIKYLPICISMLATETDGRMAALVDSSVGRYVGGVLGRDFQLK